MTTERILMSVLDAIRRMVGGLRREPLRSVPQDETAEYWTGFHTICDDREEAYAIGDYAVAKCMGWRFYGGILYKGIPTHDGRYRMDLFTPQIIQPKPETLTPLLFPGRDDITIDEVTATVDGLDEWVYGPRSDQGHRHEDV